MHLGRNPANSPVDMESIPPLFTGPLYLQTVGKLAGFLKHQPVALFLTVPQWRHGEMWTNKTPGDALGETKLTPPKFNIAPEK